MAVLSHAQAAALPSCSSRCSTRRSSGSGSSSSGSSRIQQQRRATANALASSRRPRHLLVSASLRVQEFGGQQQLPTEFTSSLAELMSTSGFRQQVARECQLPEGTGVEFEVRGAPRGRPCTVPALPPLRAAIVIIICC